MLASTHRPENSATSQGGGEAKEGIAARVFVTDQESEGVIRESLAALGVQGTHFTTGGVSQATPQGFITEEEGLNASLDGAEELAAQGVATVACVWQPCVGSAFHNQPTPSLEFHVRLARGLDQLRRQYGLNVDMDNYRRCGNHPDTDLSRLL